jgi:hypothetical protein
MTSAHNPAAVVPAQAAARSNRSGTRRMSNTDWLQEYFTNIRARFIAQRTLAESALAQLNDEELFRTIGREGNSIAVLLKHVGGNLRSRWTDPFETDGEKPDRNRDGEFEVERDSAAEVRRVWNDGWAAVERTLAGLAPADVERKLRVRDEQLSLFEALHRSLAHTAQHVGQIVLLAKQWKDSDWQTLSIPRRRSS